MRRDPIIAARARDNAAFIVEACNAYDANMARIAELESALRTAIAQLVRADHQELVPHLRAALRRDRG